LLWREKDLRRWVFIARLNAELAVEKRGKKSTTKDAKYHEGFGLRCFLRTPVESSKSHTAFDGEGSRQLRTSAIILEKFFLPNYDLRP